jgi:hypothetical protein
MKKMVSHFTRGILFWIAFAPDLVIADAVVPNDDFESAILISGGDDLVMGNNLGATQEPNEPAFLREYGNGQSIWWRWTAPESIRYVFETVGSSRDTILGIYQGTNLGDLVPVLEVDDGIDESLESRGSFLAVAGTEYFIAVDVFSGDEPGPINLNWYPQAVPELSTPAMVYNLRQVVTEQGYDEERSSGEISVFRPRSTSVVTGLVVRGRSDLTSFESGTEVGPVAVIELYTKRVGRSIKKYYLLNGGTVSDSEVPTYLWMETSLIRVGNRASNVLEIASIETGGDQGIDAVAIKDLKGQASLSKILPSEETAVWFARRLTSSNERYISTRFSETLVQGQPIEGEYLKENSTLTFNATETRALEGMVFFDDALAEVIARLEAKGYESALLDVE